MIKELVKHQIYETCIDIFFAKMSKNFNRITLGEDRPKVGSFYRMISHNYGDEHYHNCTVKSIEHRGSDDSHYSIVYVIYEYATGKDIIGLNEIETYLNDEGIDDEDDEITAAIEDGMSIGDLFENDDIEFLESDGVIALNSKYYVFYK